MRNIAIFIALVSLTSCAQVPKESAYLLSYQHKMQASHHWDLLAKDVADDVKSNATIKSEKVPISVMYNPDRSPFGDAMRTFLDTEFKCTGYDKSKPQLVLTDRLVPYRLVLEVQPVFHAADRRNTWGGLPFFLLLDLPQEILLGETDCNWRKKPHWEVIVTYELWKDNLSLLRKSKIFYINDADYGHYVAMIGPSLVSDLSSVRYNMKDN